ncbi:hypothetical protein [Nonomuraea recticatena]|uniref:hypothetical protein n=1 Tax=Nonomuraea recticatena TaxID=46178 RepID=UPI0036066FB4
MPQPAVAPRPVVVPPKPPRVTPSPPKTPVPQARTYVRAERPKPARRNPMRSVLVMVVLTTVIASTTAVAFGAIR